MPGPGRKFEKGNPGKPAGATNHVTRSVKEVIAKAVQDAQADPKHPANVANFSKEFPREFWQVAAKLIPEEIRAALTHSVTPEVGVIVDAMVGKKPVK